MRTTVPILLSATVIALAGCGTQDTGRDADSAAQPPATAAPASPGASASAPGGGGTSSGSTAGAYLTKAEYEATKDTRSQTKVVLFFHAPWCPDCRATEKAIDESGVPQGLTVVKVDYDSDTDLRKQYGVTQQHTFVQVAADGAQIGKWTGSKDGAAILAKAS